MISEFEDFITWLLNIPNKKLGDIVSWLDKMK